MDWFPATKLFCNMASQQLGEPLLGDQGATPDELKPGVRRRGLRWLRSKMCCGGDIKPLPRVKGPGKPRAKRSSAAPGRGSTSSHASAALLPQLKTLSSQTSRGSTTPCHTLSIVSGEAGGSRPPEPVMWAALAGQTRAHAVGT